MSDEDDHYADVGFMFEGSEASTWKHFEFSQDERIIKVALSVVDEDPGAVQSGHYLWPGAPVLAKHLLSEVMMKPCAVLELGAGCALSSIAALQAFPSIQYLVATDHDPGTLERAEQNHDATLEYLGDEDFATRLLTLSIRWELLTWGDEEGANNILSEAPSKFDLVLGSDLIYDRDVVKPLFVSVSLFMARESFSKFILSQSFVYDDATEREIDDMCETIGLLRTVIADDLSVEGGAKLQYFQWR